MDALSLLKKDHDKMFPRAKKLLGAAELESLGKRMEQRKLAKLKSAA